jgi:hypothetical protein
MDLLQKTILLLEAQTKNGPPLENNTEIKIEKQEKQEKPELSPTISTSFSSSSSELEQQLTEANVLAKERLKVIQIISDEKSHMAREIEKWRAEVCTQKI